MTRLTLWSVTATVYNNYNVALSTDRYSMMKKCWKADPNERPTFATLVSELDRMLTVATDYLELTSLTVCNQQYFLEPDTGQGVTIS